MGASACAYIAGKPVQGRESLISSTLKARRAFLLAGTSLLLAIPSEAFAQDTTQPPADQPQPADTAPTAGNPEPTDQQPP